MFIKTCSKTEEIILLKTINIIMIGLLMTVTAAVAEPLKVGFIYIGPPGDHGWTYRHDIGRKDIEAHFGDKVT